MSDEKKLPKEMEESLDLVTQLLLRVKEFLKWTGRDYIERLAWFLAGAGFVAYMTQMMIWFQFIGGL